MRLITEDRSAQVDDVLNRICEALQLNKSRREKVNARYEAVSGWIEKDDGYFKDAKIYAQGSYRIGTIIKPQKGEEFDLDFVVQTNKDWTKTKFMDLYKSFKNRLADNDSYEGKLIEKTRCIRINYADEFHMDVIPTCTEGITDDINRIMVPDKKEHDWAISNPEGYALWFESNYIDESSILLKGYYSGEIMEKAEDLPEDVPYELKQPLQRAVQLLKRFRDIYFEDDVDSSPSSIVLTTVAGLFYKQETSIYDAIGNIVHNIKLNIDQLPTNTRFKIVNPVNKEEEFTKEWEDNPVLFKSFLQFIKDLHSFWTNMNNLSTIDLPKELKARFGENIVLEAYNSQGDYIHSLRRNQSTAISKSTGVAASILSENVKEDTKNTFYGI